VTFAQTLKRGWPVVIEVGETLPGRPDLVWDLITDWERQGDWMLEASDFRVVSSHREGVGVEADATIRIAGIKTRDRIRVVGWEPGHRLAIQHLGWVKGQGELHLTPMGNDRTHIFWREELEPPLGIAGAVGLLAFRRLMRRLFKRDLQVLSLLVASHATAGRGPA
jgi:Polyketide cyclase / dehydrase and lipid transport